MKTASVMIASFFLAQTVTAQLTKSASCPVFKPLIFCMAK
jgi:hypothetical protein